MDMVGVAVSGFLLGWSVAWPPGPINAEILRRAVTRGFWSAAAVGFGACAGDALWALAVGLGAGALLTVQGAATALWYVSRALLIGLAALFLHGAWRVWQRPAGPAPSRWDAGRAGFALGFVLALTSPFNVAFWVGVLGRPELVGLGPAAALVTALAVIVGAATWVVCLATAAGSLQRFLRRRAWEAGTRLATAALLLAFALA